MNIRKLPSASQAFKYPLLIKSILAYSTILEPHNEIVYKDSLRYNYFELNRRVRKQANVLKNMGIDGGKTWTPINPENIPTNQEGEAAFAASGTSLIVSGKSNVYICTGGAKNSRIFRSTDQGNNWEVINTTMSASQASGLFGMRFWDINHGVAVGGDYLAVNKAIPNVLLTSDGGKTWLDAPQTNPAGLKESVAIYQKKILIAVGPSGTSFSKDFGKSWKAIDTSAFHAISIMGNSIWAVGGRGNIAKLDTSFLEK